MAEKDWLPLTEYSSKYRVSISTLRRRIKGGRAEFIYEEGKYLLKDSPLAKHSLTPLKPSTPMNDSPDSRVTIAPPQPSASGHPVHRSSNEEPQPAANRSGLDQVSFKEDESSPVLSTANQLLKELKKAYTLILQEKEEQVLLLKEEVADLRTLVSVLETENDRLRKNKQESTHIDSWLDSIELEK